MKMNKKIIVILIMTLFIGSSINVIADLNNNNLKEQEIRSYINEVTKKWTWMFYNDADFTPGFDPFEMFTEEAYSGENLDVIMLRDTYGSPAKYWYIDENHNVDLLEDLGEVNMGEFQTLYDFVEYSKNNFPAERYLLSFYDHGGGWRGACRDDTDSGWLTMDEMQKALLNSGGVDIICFTAPCLMGAFESVYELRDATKVFVGSEDTSGYAWWGYIISDICDILEDNSDIDTITLGEQIIDVIWDDHDRWDYKEAITMSAIRTDKMDDLANHLDTFARSVDVDKCNNILSTIISDIETFYYDYAKDLYDFAEKYNNVISDGIINELLNNIMNSLSESVIAECHGNDHPNANGLTIFLPFASSSYYSLYISSEYGLDFPIDSYWDELLSILNDFNVPPDKPNKPIGEINGTNGEEYTYSTSTVDANGDKIYYAWDWGDGHDSGWIGPYESGEICEASYNWEKEGIYGVKVIAKDERNKLSEWSDPLEVSMPKSISIFNPRLFRLIQRFPILEFLI